MESNRTWDIIPLPSGKRAISSKWVYKIKQRADGFIECYKARLVIRGDTQKEGVDYFETFSLVVKITMIKCLLTIVVKKYRKIFQLNMNNAFLHGDLDEEVYMKIPQGLEVLDSISGQLVCKLPKSLYGLKQASRQWYTKLSSALLSRGYVSSLNDYSIFKKVSGAFIAVMAIYVDDILLVGDDVAELNSLKLFLDESFKIKDLGEAHYFLGLEILCNPNGLLVTQRKYAYDFLSEFNCYIVTLVVSLLELNGKLSVDSGDLCPDPTLYRKLVGKLNFLQQTYPDISFAVQHLSLCIVLVCLILRLV